MVTFTKYHGCGNDFIILKEQDAQQIPYSELAVDICHRTLGIGADGLIIVKQNPLEMIFYNSDGSRAPMCGNGIRCFAKFCRDEGICTEDSYPVETLAGTMGVRIVKEDPFLVEIKMGKPAFDPQKLGIDSNEKDFLKRELELKNGKIIISSCFMGTIHTVLWLDDLDDVDLEVLGKEISNHPVFREKTNVNMVQVIDKQTLRLMTYERGVGLTNACGTGACASVVIGNIEEKCGKEADIILPYGKLHILQNNEGEVIMTGPAEKIGQGSFQEHRRER